MLLISNTFIKESLSLTQLCNIMNINYFINLSFLIRNFSFLTLHVLIQHPNYIYIFNTNIITVFYLFILISFINMSTSFSFLTLQL
jgi:hypothetical protein